MSIYKERGVYAIVNTLNNKKYIGCTNMNFGDRRDCHYALLRHGNHHNKELQKDYTKNPNNIIFEIIESVSDISDDELFEKEKFWINKTRENGLCYNATDGGIGGNGLRLPLEHYNKIGLLNSKRLKGTKLSKDITDKMKQSHEDNLGRVHGDNNSTILTEKDVKEIKTALMNGEFCSKLSKKYNVTVGCISLINVGKTWKNVYVDG